MRRPSGSSGGVRRSSATVALLFAAVFAGCVVPRATDGSGCEGASLDALNSPHPVNDPPHWNGTSDFLLDPQPPVLTPGAANRFYLRFTNDDCRPFVYRQPMVFCGGALFAFGTAPLRFSSAGHSENVSFNLLNFHSCGVAMTAGYHQVEPLGTYERAVVWDGGLDVFDHADAENGVDWQKRRYYLAPGPWPLGYGFSWGTSYPVAKSAMVDVLENEFNRDSPLEFGACRNLRGVMGASVEGTVEASRPAAPIGTRVDVWTNYTLILPEPGCYIFEGEPNVALTPEGSWVRYSLGNSCIGTFSSGDPFIGVVRADSTRVEGRFHHEMDGRADATSKCRPALTPGRYNVTFEFGAGLYWSAPRPNPVTVFEWL